MNTPFISLGLESIKQQKPDFFRSLAAIYSRYRGLRKAELVRSDLPLALSECVAHYMRVPVKFGFDESDEDITAFTISFFDPTLPLSPNLLRNQQSRLLNLHFDLANARVLGDTKDLVCVGFVPTAQIIDRRNSDEMLAAVTLHECGHLYLELMALGSLARVNPAIERVARDFDRNPDYNYRRQLVVREFKDSDLTPDALERIAQADDKVQVITRAVTESRDNLVHLLGSNVYDQTISEAVADEFAVRFGAGQALARYMDIQTRAYRAKGQALDRRAGYYVRVTAGLVGVAVATLGAGLAVAAAVGSALAIAFSAIWTAPTRSDYKYDRDRDRLVRIRNQMQLRMRTLVKNATQYKAIKLELDTVDELIRNTDPGNDSFATVFAQWFNPEARARLAQSKTEHQYEALAYNPLFDAAFNLKYSKK